MWQAHHYFKPRTPQYQEGRRQVVPSYRSYIYGVYILPGSENPKLVDKNIRRVITILVLWTFHYTR